MKRVLLLSIALVLAAASVAHAVPTINISWDACLGDGGTSLKTFSCTTNLNNAANNNSLAPAITFDAPYSGVNGFDVHLTVGTEAALPAFWALPDPSTGGASLVCAAKSGPIYTATAAAPCSNAPYGAGPGGGQVPLTGTDLQPNPNAMNLRFAFASPQGNEQNVTAQEYGVATVQIDNRGATGACAGCLTPACIRITQITVGMLAGNQDFTQAGTQFAYWQSATVNCQSTPVHNKTWGAVKALYR